MKSKFSYKLKHFEQFLNHIINTLYLILFIVGYIIYLTIFGLNFANYSSIIINGFFLFAITLLIFNYFFPQQTLNLAKTALIIGVFPIISGILVFPYVVIPTVVISIAAKIYANIGNNTMNDRMILLSSILAISTIFSGLFVWLFKWSLHKLPKQSPLSSITNNIDSIFHIIYLITILISGLLTFVVSFVPAFYPILDSKLNPVPTKLDSKLFIYLLILFQAVAHSQVVETFKKIKN